MSSLKKDSDSAEKAFCRVWVPDAALAAGHHIRVAIEGEGAGNLSMLRKQFVGVTFKVSGEAATDAPPTKRLHVSVLCDTKATLDRVGPAVVKLVEGALDILYRDGRIPCSVRECGAPRVTKYLLNGGKATPITEEPNGHDVGRAPSSAHQDLGASATVKKSSDSSLLASSIQATVEKLRPRSQNAAAHLSAERSDARSSEKRRRDLPRPLHRAAAAARHSQPATGRKQVLAAPVRKPFNASESLIRALRVLSTESALETRAICKLVLTLGTTLLDALGWDVVLRELADVFVRASTDTPRLASLVVFDTLCGSHDAIKDFANIYLTPVAVCIKTKADDIERSRFARVFKVGHVARLLADTALLKLVLQQCTPSSPAPKRPLPKAGQALPFAKRQDLKIQGQLVLGSPTAYPSGQNALAPSPRPSSSVGL